MDVSNPFSFVNLSFPAFEGLLCYVGMQFAKQAKVTLRSSYVLMSRKDFNPSSACKKYSKEFQESKYFLLYLIIAENEDYCAANFDLKAW